MTTAPSIAVEFKKVMKSFGEKRVLNDVSFKIEQGKALCLLGRSGTGKSVTLKLIMALMRPDSGEVLVDRDNVVGMREQGLSHVRRKLGYLSRMQLCSTHSLFMKISLFRSSV
jgi:phospholipid/cholesterol/gamma-HCH transport system ATP-binding protein